jgi:hypothetical protein
VLWVSFYLFTFCDWVCGKGLGCVLISDRFGGVIEQNAFENAVFDAFGGGRLV